MQMELDLGAMLAGQLPPGVSLPEGFDEPMTVVVDGATTYLRMPMLDAITGTSGWLSVSPDDLGVGQRRARRGLRGDERPRPDAGGAARDV